MKKNWYLIFSFFIIFGYLFSQTHDVSVLAIISPVDTIKEDTIIFPIAQITNLGTAEDSFPCLFRITDNNGSVVYFNIDTIRLMPGETIQYTFSESWQALRGNYTVRCSTMLEGDENNNNDFKDSSLFVVYHDVGVLAIINPPDTIIENDNVVPTVQIANFGNVEEKFPIKFQIFSLLPVPIFTVIDTISLLPNETLKYNFSDTWQAIRGNYQILCATMLALDQDTTNDYIKKPLFVVAHDVGVEAIISPVDSALENNNLIPSAQIKNYGNVSESFKAIFKIGNVYEETLDIVNLQPDSIVKPLFPSWVAVRGNYTVSCTTLLSNDLYPDNNKKDSSLFVIAHDVGVEYLVSPVDTVLAGTLVTPQALVKNYGNVNESFDVIFRIGDVYEDTVSVNNLLPDSVLTVTFNSWTAVVGSYTVSCTTLLTNDLYPNNDKKDSSLFVVYHDVGVEYLISPVDTVLEGDWVRPQVRVYNLGNILERFPVSFKIGGVFNIIDTISLGAGETLDYAFSDSWQAIRGSYVVSCSTMLTTDMNNANDFKDSSLFVIAHDLMTLEILEPVGRILPGTVVNPRAKIRNNGTEMERNFPVMFRIGTVYLSSLTIDSLLPGTDTIIQFSPPWTATVGTYVVSCSTMLSIDVNRLNDKVDSIITVLAHDVGVIAILTPIDSLPESTNVFPQARVKNYGNSIETFNVRFKIGNLYDTIAPVISLEPDSERTITFSPAWTALRGNYLVACSTELVNDDNTSNDRQTATLQVYAYDVGVSEILEPKGYLNEGNLILPKAKIKNFGNRVVSCTVYLAIGDTIRRKAYLSSLLPDSERVVVFTPAWQATRGFYLVKCSTALVNDMYHHNDTLIDSVKVLPATRMAIYFQDFNSSWSTVLPPPGWRIYFTGDTSENDWHRKSANQAPWTQNPTPYPAIFYRYSSDAPDSLISPIINCHYFRNVLLKVNVNFKKRGNNYRAKIIGKDGNSDAVYLIKEYTDNFGPAIDSFNLPWADGKDSVEISFVFEGDLGDIYYWCIDDFGLYGDTVYNYDVAFLEALSPKSFELPQPTPVAGKIANVGLENIPSCTVKVVIKDTFGNIAYQDSQIVSINSGETLTVNFANWNADTGHYQVKFFTKISNDENPFNDTLTYACYVNWEKLYYYDDGVVYRDTAFYLFDQGMGVRYLPERYPAKIKEVQVYLNIDTITYANRFKIRITKDDGPDSSPGTLLYESPELAGFNGWNNFTLPITLTIDSGGFYLFYLQTDDYDNTPKLGRDRARNINALHRYYFMDDYDSLGIPKLVYKKDTTNGDWLIRVVINYEPVLPPPFPDARANFVYRPRGELSLRPKGITYLPQAVIQNISNWKLYNPPVSCTIYDSLMNVVYYSSSLIDSIRPNEAKLINFHLWEPNLGGKYYVKVRTHFPGDLNPDNDTATKIIYLAPPLFTGGPDHGIYRHFWIDSDTISGPRFNWIDTTNSFRLITEGDNAIVGINLPFRFQFYDTSYDYLWISVDGFVAFGERPQGTGQNTPIPYYASPNNAIFAYWDDLICGRDFGGGSISYKIIGEKPERKVVIIYQNMRRKGTDYRNPNAGLTFEIILQENGNIIIQYLDVNCGDRRYNNGRSASCGIEDATGNIGLEYLYGEGKLPHNYPNNKLTDSLAISFYRYFQDCGILKIVSPKKGTFIGELRPNYLVKNLGTLKADTLKGYCKIFDINSNLIYFDSLITTLNVGDSMNFIFTPINLSYGRYTILCSLWTSEDIYPENDTLRLRFEVNKWIELSPIPRGYYGRRVKWGALTYVPTEKRVYALKGANTNEFWYYDVEKDTWDTMPSLPDSSIYTNKRKRVKYGCALTYSPVDQKIYATKGGGSQEFYAFDLVSRRWTELCTIPKLGARYRVYGFDKGTALVYEPNTQMVYATKGGNTNEFWAYNPLTNRWTKKMDIPLIPSLKTCGVGTAMCAGDGKIYLVKGRNTYDFYYYNPLKDSWYELRSVTYKPSGKRVSKGAALAYYNNKVYLVKGGNSQDFVSYDVLADSWVVKDTIPRGAYKRKVKGGAAMTATDDGILYLFKGGNTNEFWAYSTIFDTIFISQAKPIAKSIMEEEVKRIEEALGIKIYPNPATKNLYFLVNGDELKEIKIYNSLGRLVKAIKINKKGIYSWNFKKEKVPKGIYLIKINGKEERKIKVILL